MQGVSFELQFDVGIEDNVKLQNWGKIRWKMEKQQSKQASKSNMYFSSVATVAGRLSHRQDFPASFKASKIFTR